MLSNANSMQVTNNSFSLYDEQGNMIGSALANEFNIDANGVWSFDAIGTSWTPVDTYKCVELNYHY